MQYAPITVPLLMLLWILFGILALLIQNDILEFAFETMGVSRRYMFTLLMPSLPGSYINIPILEWAPVAPIGGAGKFDGVFLTGLMAVLLAGLFGPRRRKS